MRNSSKRLATVLLILGTLSSNLTQANTFEVTNTDDSGAGSLRACIDSVNATLGPHTIVFHLPGASNQVQVITPTTPYPVITNQVHIDGWSQNIFSGSTNGDHLVELKGQLVPAPADALNITADSSIVEHLIINQWFGDAVKLNGADGFTVWGCYLGTNPQGTGRLPNDNGIHVINCNGGIIGDSLFRNRNLLSGNRECGARISGSSNISVDNNFVGLSETSFTLLSNDLNGILVENGSTNISIGGQDARTRNSIGGNLMNGIRITGAGTQNVRLLNNRIGTDSIGTSVVGNNGYGIVIDGGASEVLVLDGNIITSNGFGGVHIEGVGTKNNVIEGSYIGLDQSGINDLGNFGPGVFIESGASNNTIGTTQVGGANFISCNINTGIEIEDADSNIVLGNVIGLYTNGNPTNPRHGNGILITGTSVSNQIGDGTSLGRNVISNSTQNGVMLAFGARYNTLRGNYIGTNTGGTGTLANMQAGILISDGASQNTIGGNSVGDGNLISGNTSWGILMRDVETDSNVVSGNIIGLNALQSGTLQNNIGIEIRAGSNSNWIGSGRIGGGNTIAGNALTGVAITGSGTNDNRVYGNYIGMSSTGASGMGNSGNGIGIDSDADSNIIGGTADSLRNYIGGNVNGVDVSSSNTEQTRLEGNWVGLGVDGTSFLPNSNFGISVHLARNTDIVNNVVSGNASTGISTTGNGPQFTTIKGNLIGTDTSGLVSIPNGSIGIYVGGGQDVVIGGTLSSERNVISGNTGYGVYAAANSHRLQISGNFVGVDKTGIAGLGNGAGGIEITGSSQNVIVGGALGSGNVVSANTFSGVKISGAGTHYTRVLGNVIGFGLDTTTVLGNGESGIYIENGAQFSVCGSVDSFNVIGNNTAAGVFVQGTNTDNHLLSPNSFRNNQGLGIALGSTNVLANDAAGDFDVGANEELNWPVISSATINGNTLDITGTLTTGFGKSVIMHFYSSPTPNSSGNGEGWNYLGQFAGTGSALDGTLDFALSFPGDPLFPVVSAVTVDDFGHTSEFSNAVVAPVSITSPVANKDYYLLETRESQRTIDVLANDTDLENDIDSTSLSLLSIATGGAAVVLPGGKIGYTPSGSYVGFDSVQYRVCDETSLCDSAWLYLKLEDRSGVSIEGGWRNVVAQCADGSAWAAGRNDDGQIGKGDKLGVHFVPRTVLSTDGITPMTNAWHVTTATGGTFAMILDTDELVVWGDSARNKIPVTGLSDDQVFPTYIESPAATNMPDVFDFSYGNNTGYAIMLSDGGMKTWGWNNQGQMGIGVTGGTFDPTDVPSHLDWFRVEAQDEHAIALKRNGTAFGAGVNQNGKLGDGTSATRNGFTQLVNSAEASGMLEGVSQITAGEVFGAALLFNGQVLAWGENDQGECGRGFVSAEELQPSNVVGVGGSGVLKNVVSISAGNEHALALLQNGYVVSWGLNDNGVLGDGTTTARNTPDYVYLNSGKTDTLKNINYIATGDYFSLAIDDEGVLYAWGDNSDGQLATGTSSVGVLLPEVISAVPAGCFPGFKPPVANRDQAAVQEDGNVIVDVALNDTDENGDLNPTTVVIVEQPINGIATILSSNVFYSPDPDFWGLDSLRYRICDSASMCDEAWLVINVQQLFDDFVGQVDSISISEDSTIIDFDVFANDIDGDNCIDSNATILSRLPVNGVASIDSMGQLFYQPNLNFQGQDSLTYQVCCSQGQMTTGQYVGDGLSIHQVDVGFEPDLVFVKDEGSGSGMIKLDVFPGVDSKPLVNNSSVQSNAITDLNSNGFNVAQDGKVNQGGNNYNFLAMQKAVGYMETGTYEGNQVDGREIDGLSFSPEWVMVIRMDDNDNPVVRFAEMTIGESTTLDDAFMLPDRILDFSGDGFVLGPDHDVNEPGVTYYWVAISEGSGMDIGSYVGNSDASQSIVSQVEGEVVFVNPIGRKAVWRTSDMDSSEAQFLSTGLQTDLVGAFDSLTFDVAGVTTCCNESGDTYHYMALASGVANGGHQTCTEVPVYINVAALNDPVVANADYWVTKEDSNIVLSVLDNDIDPELQIDTASLVVLVPPHRASAVVANGLIQFNPQADSSGLDSLQYRICDSQGACDSNWVLINVQPVFDDLVAVDDNYTIDEDDTLVTLSMLGNDIDPDMALDPSTLVFTSGVSNGQLLYDSSNGQLTYIPDSNFYGSEVINYEVCTRQGEMAVGNYTGDGNQSQTIGGLAFEPNMVLVKRDVDWAARLRLSVFSDSMSHTITDGQSPVDNGVVSLESDGFVVGNEGKVNESGDTFNFLALKSFPGFVEMGNYVGDGLTSKSIRGLSFEPEWVMVFEEGTPSDPIVSFDGYPDSMSTAYSNRSTLSNRIISRDEDGFTVGSHSSVNTNGQTYYWLAFNEGNGLDIGDYIGFGVMPQTLGTINDLGAVMIKPTSTRAWWKTSVMAQDISQQLGAGLESGHISNFTSNSFDVETGLECCNDLSFMHYYVAFSESRNGGGHLHCQSARVDITVTPVDDSIVVNRDALAVWEDSSGEVNVLLNDFDLDNAIDSTSLAILQGPFFGTASLLGNGVIQYSGNPDYNGLDSLLYSVCDEQLPGVCDSAWLIIDVLPNTDPLVVHDDILTVLEDRVGEMQLPDNVDNIDGLVIDTNSITVVTAPSNGSLLLLAGGQMQYDPDSNYFGPDSIRFSVCDTSNQFCDQFVVFITVFPIDDTIVVNEDILVVLEDSVGSINVLGNDFDIDSGIDSGSVAFNSGPFNGIMTDLGNGLLRYEPNVNYNGGDSLLYSACDTQDPAVCDSAWLRIDVLPQADLFDLSDTTLIVLEDSSETFLWLSSLVNDDGLIIDTAGVQTLAGPLHGSVVYLGGAQLQYTPDSNYFGVDSLQLSVCDTSGLNCADFWVRVDVIPVNDSPVALDSLVRDTGRCGTFSVDVTSLFSDMDLGDTISFSTFDPRASMDSSVLTVSYLSKNAPDTVLVIGTDLSGASDTSLVFIELDSNQAPVFNDSIVVDRIGKIWTVDLAEFLTDPDGVDWQSLVLPVVTNDSQPVFGALGNSVLTINYEDLDQSLGPDFVAFSIEDGFCNQSSFDLNLERLEYDEPFTLGDTKEERTQGCGSFIIDLFEDDDLPLDQIGNTWSLSIGDGFDRVDYDSVGVGKFMINGLSDTLGVFTDTLQYSVCNNIGTCQFAIHVLGFVESSVGVKSVVDSSILQSVTFRWDLTQDLDNIDISTLALSDTTTAQGGPAKIEGRFLEIDYVTVRDSILGKDSLSYTICDTICNCEEVKLLLQVFPDINKIEFYNGISPNDDGNNDVFVIDLLHHFPENEVLIFSRWGDVVYNAKGYNNTTVVWDGTFNVDDVQGDLLPEGTYFYQVIPRGVGPEGDKKFTGFVELRR